MSSPLIPKPDNVDYGAMGDDHHSHGQGGLISTVPTEGYCLVFDAECDWYKLAIQNDSLVVEPLDPDLTDNFNAKWEKEFGEKRMNLNKDNLLAAFREANIQYSITRSNDKMKRYIYVVIACKKSIAEEWADKHNLDVPIDPEQAVIVGRGFDEFLLAQRTYVPNVDVKTKDNPHPERFEVETDVNKKDSFPKISLTLWNNIHIGYETTIDRAVYQKSKDKGRTESVITHRLYLRILYEMLTDDVKLGGANFIVERYLAHRSHPLQYFFALHQSIDDPNRPEFQLEKRIVCRTPDQNLEFCNSIRNYYGENIGFYFSFLCHYTKWLYVISILGTIWFIAQLIYGDIAVPGSTLVVLLTIMWSTIMIENWYRREYKLRFEWGMMRYEVTEVPRPTFAGKLAVSPENGHIVETFKSWKAHCCKMTCSFSTMLFFIMIVIGAVVALWLLKDINKSDNYLSIGIGIANSVQIFIMNKLYTYLALQLNEWEGHRLQQDYYDNLVVKRIIFIVVNSFNSLFYLAFFQSNDIYNDDGALTVEEADTKRLEAVRIQLLTLFITAIVIQNSVEILFPWVTKKVKYLWGQHEEDEFIKDNDAIYGADSADDALLNADKTAIASQGLYMNPDNVIDAGDDNIQRDFGSKDDILRTDTFGDPKLNSTVIADIEEQVQLSPSPDVLDNTAEVVILHGYIMLFVVIFPMMPLLAAVNNYFELRIDFFNLINSQRGVPVSANGIGVWKTVMATFNIIAIFSNLALICFRTTLVTDLDFMKSGDLLNQQQKVIMFYFMVALLLLFLIGGIRVAIDDQTLSTKQAIARQEACERHLLMAPVSKLAKEAHSTRQIKGKQKQSMQPAAVLSINNSDANIDQDDDDQKHDII